MKQTPLARFWAKVEPDHATGCWQWVAARNGMKDPRPYFWDGKTQAIAYRYIYEQLRGPIADGLVCDHLCRNTLCVNPYHIELVTQPVNASRERGDIVRTGKFRCGHPATEENTAPNGTSRHGRKSVVCRMCRDARNAARHTAA